MPTGSILDTLTAHRAVATIPAVVACVVQDFYRRYSLTGLLAMGYGIWLLLNAVAVLSPMKFFSSMQPIHAIQLMAIGGIAQHTKGLRPKED